MQQRMMVRIALIVIAFQANLLSQILPFRHYTRDEELVANDVTSLYQDSLKYLWIGTANGISRFDGSQFINYTTYNGLPLNFVNRIIESQGWLWVGNFDGLCRTPARITSSEHSFQKFVIDSLNDARKILSMVNDSTGTFWCATEKGVFQIRDKSVSEFLYNGKHVYAHSIVRSSDNTLWINNESNLIVHHPIRSMTESIELPQRTNVSSLAADHSGNV